MFFISLRYVRSFPSSISVTIGTNNLTLFYFVFDSRKAYGRVCIPCKVVLFLARDVVEVHLAIVIFFFTVRTGVLFFNLTNVFLVSVSGLTLPLGLCGCISQIKLSP